MPAVIDHEAAAMAFTRLVDLSTQHELTIYDATYIEESLSRLDPRATSVAHSQVNYDQDVRVV